MLAPRTTDVKDLTVLRFPDRETFYLATDILSQYGVIADALGNYTLLIHKSDQHYIQDLPAEERDVTRPASS